MKAEHRHELKSNELAEWLANLPQWAKENLRFLLIIAAVIVAVLVFYIYRTYSNLVTARNQIRLTSLVDQIPASKMQIVRAHSQGKDLSFVLLQPADSLRGFAQAIGDDRMAAFALIKRADALRAELHYRPSVVPKQDLVSQINLAKESYRQALDKAAGYPPFMAAAEFGLGLCAEELGDRDQAKQIYQKIIETPAYAGTATVSQARFRLDMLDQYDPKITLPPKPAPKPEPNQPATTAPAAAEPNKPAATAEPKTDQPAVSTPNQPVQDAPDNRSTPEPADSNVTGK